MGGYKGSKTKGGVTLAAPGTAVGGKKSTYTYEVYATDLPPGVHEAAKKLLKEDPSLTLEEAVALASMKAGPDPAATMAELTTAASAAEWLGTKTDVVAPDGQVLAADDAWDALEATAPSWLDHDVFDGVYPAAMSGWDQAPAWKISQLEALEAWQAARDDDTLSTADKYQALQGYIATVDHALVHAPAEAADAERDAARTEAAAWLETLPADQLHALATGHGFAYPQLVGLTGWGPSTPHPLTVWLNPGEDAAAQQLIQAKAADRAQQILAGKLTVPGVSPLALTLPEPADGHLVVHLPWTATDQSIAELVDTWEGPGDVAGAMYVHGRAAMAVGPDADQVAAAVAHIPKPAGAMMPPVEVAARWAYLHRVEMDDAKLASTAMLAAWSNPHADPADLAQAAETLEGRKAAVGQLTTLGPISDTNVGMKVSQWSKVSQAKADLGPAWSRVAHLEATGPVPAASLQVPNKTVFRQWAKERPLGDLRAAAVEAGLDPELAKPPATRAQITNWLHGAVMEPQWPKPLATATAKLAAQHQKSKAPAAVAAAAAVPQAQKAAAPPRTKAYADGIIIRHKSFNLQLDELGDVLAQAQAVAQDVPARQPDTVVQARTFAIAPSSTAPEITPGAHQSYVLTDESGSAWFGKPYGSQPARIEAEVAASRVKAAVGLPTVPVHAATAAGTPMAVQAVVAGAAPLTGTPVSSLSQADVDQVLRQHVGDWLVGDHDAHAANWIRTPNGAITRVDHGQAYKHAGSGTERLDTSWTPNGLGKFMPLPKAVMNGHTAGTLADGVQVQSGVLNAVIGRVEQLDEGEYRDMLRPLAEAGAADAATSWRAPMRKAAAKAHGIPEAQVTNGQIADRFLDVAIDRKRSVRADFIGHLKDHGIDTTMLEV